MGLDSGFTLGTNRVHDPRIALSNGMAAAARHLMSDTIVVIGDKFAALADGTAVVTVQQLSHGADSRLLEARRIIVGQGVGPAGLAAIRQAIAKCPPAQAPALDEHVSRRADPGLVHKHCVHNVMITRPQPAGPDRFAAQLVLDDACAELADHVTGVHVQGMVLVEAARQMFIAVSAPICALSGFDSDRTQHLLRDMRASFRRFVYPLPTELRLSIDSTRRVARTPLLVTTMTVRVEQDGEEAASIHCKAVSQAHAALAQHERAEADRHLGHWLQARPPLPSVGQAR